MLKNDHTKALLQQLNLKLRELKKNIKEIKEPLIKKKQTKKLTTTLTVKVKDEIDN